MSQSLSATRRTQASPLDRILLTTLKRVRASVRSVAQIRLQKWLMKIWRGKLQTWGEKDGKTANMGTYLTRSNNTMQLLKKLNCKNKSYGMIVAKMQRLQTCLWFSIPTLAPFTWKFWNLSSENWSLTQNWISKIQTKQWKDKLLNSAVFWSTNLSSEIVNFQNE